MQIKEEEKIINIGLYGGKGLFGGKEKPLEASIIYCDRCDKCSYYKNNQCLNVRSLSGHCKYGRISNVRGYTSRAMKYYSFKEKWKEHESYEKLNHPPEKLGLIDNEVVFPYSHIRITEKENGYFEFDVPYFSSQISFIQYEKFDADFIKRICDFRPQAMMGGNIRSYHEETVPLFLAHLKEILPDRFNEFKQKYPSYIKEVNYVDRKALLKTIKPSYVYYESKSYPQFDEKWYWDGEMLIYKEGYLHGFSITDDYEVSEIKIKPSDKSTIKISDNNQVTENTVFID